MGDRIMRNYPDRGMHGTVVRGLGVRIVQGAILTGQVLNLDELGESFDVSRTVMREAVKVLAAKGLLDARPKRGTSVRDRKDWNLLDPDVLRWQYELDGDPAADMLDKLAEVRAIIEPASAALAARRRTAEDLVAMDNALAVMRQTGGDAESMTQSDAQFHRALLHATHNELLVQMEIVIDAGLHVRNRYVHRHSVAVQPSHIAHARVLEAVRARDAEAARSDMCDLLDRAAEDVRNLRRKVSREEA